MDEDRPILGTTGGGGGQSGYKPAGPSRRECWGTLSALCGFATVQGVSVSLRSLVRAMLDYPMKCLAPGRHESRVCIAPLCACELQEE